MRSPNDFDEMPIIIEVISAVIVVGSLVGVLIYYFGG